MDPSASRGRVLAVTDSSFGSSPFLKYFATTAERVRPHGKICFIVDPMNSQGIFSHSFVSSSMEILE